MLDEGFAGPPVWYVAFLKV